MDFYDIKKINPDKTFRFIIFDDFEMQLYRQGSITLEDFRRIIKEKEEYAKQMCDTMFKSLNSCINTVIVGQRKYGKKKALERYKKIKKE